MNFGSYEGAIQISTMDKYAFAEFSIPSIIVAAMHSHKI